jgi:uncharacterized protein
MNENQPRAIQLVVKISKYCNLRCSYCYEINELANKQRMDLADIHRMFVAMFNYAAKNQLEELEFVWHGGEPMLIPIDYYSAIQFHQAEVFSGKIDVLNSVQTNLTVLSPKHLEFLKNGDFFGNVGVSFDVYGDQRVDERGQLHTSAVVDNMQKLIDAKISFGAITVLARNTLNHARSIYKFWDRLGVQFRFLPFHLSAESSQSSQHALSGDEVVTTLNQIFDDWLSSDRATPVEPIQSYISYAIAFLRGDEARHYYSKSADEVVFVVNVDGSVWGAGDGELYEPGLTYGNVFYDSFDEILDSPGRKKAVAASEARMDSYCQECPYWGYCPGHFVADASKEEMLILCESGCPVSKTLDHITFTLQTLDLIDVSKSLIQPVSLPSALSVML